MQSDPVPTTRPASTRPAEQAAKPVPRPSGPFAPQPKARDPKIDARHCGHLLRRAAFGPTPDQYEHFLPMTPEERVDALFDFDPASDVGGLNAFREQARALFDIRRNINSVVEWWFHRMMQTPFPLQERVALFWHDHFATSGSKVGRADWMFDQTELFRTHGLGSFRELVLRVGRQPAMLRWLDGNNSRKGSPNENYGREIMELFCLGVGQYEERDIQELARAFTGWRIRGRSSDFNKGNHDDGEKVLFKGKPYEQRGNFNDEQAVDAILKHPAAPRFIARRLLETFVHREPSEEHVEYYANRLLAEDWQIRPVLKQMLASQFFHSEASHRARVKSPIELAVGACKAASANPRAGFLRDTTGRMGQRLLFPPNVAGWEGGAAWINSTTVIERFRFCRQLGEHGFNEFVESGLRSYLQGSKLQSADDVIDALAVLMLDGEIDDDLRVRMRDYMNLNRENKPEDFRLDGRRYNDKVRGLVQLLASSPVYQLA